MKFDGNLFIKCAGNDCPTIMEEGQERTPCLRSTCITVASSLLIPAGNFHVSVLRFNNWADTRSLGISQDVTGKVREVQSPSITVCAPSVPFHSAVPATCASHPPHQAPPFTPIPTGKQIEGGRTHNSESEGKTLSPNPFTVSDHKSQLQIELRSEITSFPPLPACRDRSSGLCFLGNKKEHHNSLLTSKWHTKTCHFFFSGVFYHQGISLNSELSTQQEWK